MRVSVVIPSYNYAVYLPAAIDSVLAQTRPAAEVIVVDDGSTDDTRELVAAYGDKVRYVYQTNQGLSAARNTGLRLASGTHVALLDSDDAFHPQKLEYQVRYLEANRQVALIGTRNWSDPARRVSALPEPSGRLIPLNDIVVRTPFCPSSVLMTRECAERVGGFDPDVSAAADRDYWIRAAAVFPVATLDSELTFYRLHPQSMSRNVELMLRHESAVMTKAFDLPQLSGQPLLQRKSRAANLYAAGLMYREAGRPWAAVVHMCRSVATWPLPLTTGTEQLSGVRLRALAGTVVRWGRYCQGLNRTPTL